MLPLYMSDCYKKEFSATVKSVKDGTFVVLSDTLFYPASGGQPHDMGKLFLGDDGFDVVFVGKFNGEISHEVSCVGLKVGDVVRGVIDWERRYLFMRYHTAAHVISTIIHEETGAKITGNQLGEDKSRIDFDVEKFDRELMGHYAAKANAIVSKGLPVNSLVLSRDEAFKIPSVCKLRKAFDDSITEIRVVDIDGFDKQACGGTHVKNTSEIGKIEMIKQENKGKSSKRLYFKIV